MDMDVASSPNILVSKVGLKNTIPWRVGLEGLCQLGQAEIHASCSGHPEQHNNYLCIYNAYLYDFSGSFSENVKVKFLEF